MNQITNTVQYNRVIKGRSNLILDHFFFGALALKLKLVEDIECETGWTDGLTIGFNPKWIESLNSGQVKGFLAHEIMHVVCLHHTRRGNRNPDKWNIAGDYCVNDILINDGFELPNGTLSGMGLDKYAEQIYNQIPDPPQGNKGQGSDKGKGKGKGSGCGEVRDYPGKDGKKAGESELKNAESETRVMVQQAVKAAKMQGKMPVGIDRVLDDTLNPKVPWKEVLWRYITQACKSDYSWSRPNKRYMGSGLILPSLWAEEMKPVFLAIDTSCSVDAKTLNQFAAEITAIHNDLQVDIIVCYCDTKVNPDKVQRFDKDEMVELKPDGSGGTDFRPPFEYLEKHQLDISCMIYLTDGYCDSFPDQCDFPVLWGIYGRNKGFDPPLGETMQID